METVRPGTIGIVILAAGESVRMGKPKQLLVYQGKTLLRHAVDTALALMEGPVVVVLGAYSTAIRLELEGMPVHIVENPDWQSGMGCSLRTGLQALLAMNTHTAAALFLLCDQPHITPELLRNMISKWRSGADIAACQYETRRGVPALFDARFFQELLALQGAEGARQMLAKNAAAVVPICFPEGSIDVDRPEDYAALLAQSRPN